LQEQQIYRFVALLIFYTNISISQQHPLHKPTINFKHIFLEHRYNHTAVG